MFLVLYPPARRLVLLPSSSLTHTHSLTLTLFHSLSLSLTHARTHSLTHTHSHSLTHPHSLSLTLTHSPSLTLTHSHSPSLSLTHSHSHSHSHSLTHTHSHSLSLTHSHSLTRSHSLTLTHSPSLTLTHSHSLTLTHSHSLSLTHSPSLSLTHSPSLSLTHSHSLTHPHSLAHSLTQSLTPSLTQSLTHSLTLSHTHSHTHPHSHSLTHSPSLTHSLPRGRMYALAPLWRSLGSAAFAWQAWDNLHCQGVGCTPWRPSGVPWAPPLLRGRRGTISTAKGSDARPGVPLAFLGLRRFCVAGVRQSPLPRAGIPWAPPLLRGRRGTISTAKGSGVRPGVPLAFLGLRRFCEAGVGQSPLPRGRMHALASLWRSLGSVAFAWQAWDNLLAKGSDVRPGVLWRSLGSVAFAWQAWDNLHCQGVGCTPWRPSGVPWEAWDHLHCQGVGCMPWRPFGVPWAPPLLRGRRGTISTAKGSDARPGVPLAFLGLRRFCVAGVGQAALSLSLSFSLSLSLTPSHSLIPSHSLTPLTHSLSLTHSLQTKKLLVRSASGNWRSFRTKSVRTISFRMQQQLTAWNAQNTGCNKVQTPQEAPNI